MAGPPRVRCTDCSRVVHTSPRETSEGMVRERYCPECRDLVETLELVSVDVHFRHSPAVRSAQAGKGRPLFWRLVERLLFIQPITDSNFFGKPLASRPQLRFEQRSCDVCRRSVRACPRCGGATSAVNPELPCPCCKGRLRAG